MLLQNSDFQKWRFIVCFRKFLKFPFKGVRMVRWMTRRDKVAFDRRQRGIFVENNNKKIPVPETGTGCAAEPAGIGEYDTVITFF